MYQKALSIYYALVMFVLGTAFLVMQPMPNDHVTFWQQDMHQQFSKAFIQTIGDGPWFEDLELVLDGIATFYDQAADSMIALMGDRETDADIVQIFAKVYEELSLAINQEGSVSGISYESISLPLPNDDFMTEDAIYNIVPYREIVKTIDSEVSTSAQVQKAVNSASNPWVTIKDNLTGQLYCLAVYNGTVNQYIGSCENGYY
jgi:hypothetical protein